MESDPGNHQIINWNINTNKLKVKAGKWKSLNGAAVRPKELYCETTSAVISACVVLVKGLHLAVMCSLIAIVLLVLSHSAEWGECVWVMATGLDTVFHLYIKPLSYSHVCVCLSIMFLSLYFIRELKCFVFLCYFFYIASVCMVFRLSVMVFSLSLSLYYVIY